MWSDSWSTTQSLNFVFPLLLLEPNMTVENKNTAGNIGANIKANLAALREDYMHKLPRKISNIDDPIY